MTEEEIADSVTRVLESSEEEAAEAVSYTHLDVYKRQVLCITGTPECIIIYLSLIHICICFETHHLYIKKSQGRLEKVSLSIHSSDLNTFVNIHINSLYMFVYNNFPYVLIMNCCNTINYLLD